MSFIWPYGKKVVSLGWLWVGVFQYFEDFTSHSDAELRIIQKKVVKSLDISNIFRIFTM